ncbi:VOC family protein [Bailinhaonella thermotolerans]|uniref:Glyoxalase n=1 Tax=Bailinhaonella thermotolerans TaxID=1070861 RepID=A0A3A4AGC6_9ACTN|nr:VOC family protein [Bailinhaonella thermotolerans]RJL24723.1 glyoxalase [Bailinhaonella thermotolerans]
MNVRLKVVELVVQDMGRSLAFYRLLGLDVPAAADGEPHVEHELPGGLKIAWDTVETIESFHPGFTFHPGAGNMALAFEADSPEEVDKVYAELTAAGYEGEMEPFDAFWGQRYAVVHDPDGNGVDIFAPLPR